MDVDAQKLFTLVDAAYNQPITNQPSDSYRQALLAAAIDLNNNVSPQQVTIQLYQAYYRNYTVPMTLPRQHRDLYQYVHTQLQRLTRKEQRHMALGYGLIATHLTFGPLNWNQGTYTHCASYRLVWSMIKPCHYQAQK